MAGQPRTALSLRKSSADADLASRDTLAVTVALLEICLLISRN